MFSRRQNPDQETQSVWWSENFCPSGAHLQCKFHPQVVFSLYVSLHVIILWRYRYRLAFRRRRRLTHSAVIIIIYIWIIRHVFSKNCLCVILPNFSAKKKYFFQVSMAESEIKAYWWKLWKFLTGWKGVWCQPSVQKHPPCAEMWKSGFRFCARDPVVKLDGLEGSGCFQK